MMTKKIPLQQFATAIIAISSISLSLMAIVSPVEARDEVAFRQYQECKKKNRQAFVKNELNGDWDTYNKIHYNFMEAMWSQKCAGIMKGKW